MRSPNLSIAVCLAAATVFAVAGCGKKSGTNKATVTGTVTYQDGPVKGAVVTFISGTEAGVGTTDENGRFTIQNVPIGKAKVTVKKVESTGGGGTMTAEDMKKRGMEKKPQPKPKDLLPVKYGSQATTDLAADVSEKDSENDFKFELK